ncbi:COMM domain-containing protein 5 [Colletes latitarsis]|uniref:COMM domain-containing protein 5 n=1 Tax=Colletes latitarsis TaxID=2605962 RepID=UPI0040358A80
MTTFQTQLLHALGNKTKVFSKLDKVFARPLMLIAVKAINQEHIEEGILDRISQKCNVPEGSVDEYYLVIYTILKVHLGTLSQDIKHEEFEKTLQDLKLPLDCIDDLSTILYGQRRRKLVASLINRTKFYPHLISCKWRVDITISSSIINRVLEPHIIMEWTFDNGKHQIFELSLSKFHLLRHAVATILVKMQKVEQQCASKNILCNC